MSPLRTIEQENRNNPMTPRFDPTRALVFDLARGQFRDAESTLRLNLPAHVLFSFCEGLGAEPTQGLARALGTELGRRTLAQMGKGPDTASVEEWTEHLGGQLALLGLGELSVEQWGKALVIAVQGAPPGSDALLGPLLGAALQRALSRDVDIVTFGDSQRLSLLVASSAGAERARTMKKQGAGLGQVVEALHGGAS